MAGLLVWVLLGSGCLAASPQPQPGRDERGVGDFVLGSAGPANYADQLPPCAGLDSPLVVCTPRRDECQ